MIQMPSLISSMFYLIITTQEWWLISQSERQGVYTMNHKQFTKTAIYAGVAGATLLLTSAVMAASTPGGTGALLGKPMLSIADSWHNLGSGNIRTTTPNGGSPANFSNDTAEICVFCHTPHGGDNSAAVPIWNRKLTDPLSYTRYSSLGTTTFDAEEAPIGSVTIACLSCHDGTQAIDSLINGPGSGFFNPAGARIGANFGGDDQVNGVLAPGPAAGGAGGIVQNLETDLSNDHPVSMQYAGGGLSTANLNGTTVDPDFVAGGNRPHPLGWTLENVPAPASSNLTTLWWIERNAESLNNGGRDRTDVIMYTRLEAETGLPGEQPFVECGSCHDPHNVDNPTFLRVSNGIPTALATDFPTPVSGNSPSALCLTCHLK